MFKTVDSKKTFPEIEEEILEFWKKNKTFIKSLKQTENCSEFVFYDGPPFATGLPHYGHLLAGTLKDIIPRYQTMKGHYVQRRFGWDCHGLPVEYEMEKELELSGKREIEDYGVSRFNEACRSIVLRYTEEWRRVVERMGRWVDFENDYKSMDPDYMESIWWVFKSLWDKKLIYESHRVVPYCARCATPLSNFETGQAYKEVQDPAITIKFKVNGKDNVYILAWTTTPWTLPSNMALYVGENIEYALVKDKNGEQYILARDRLNSYYKDETSYTFVDSYLGKDLEGWTYEPLFEYFNDKAKEGAFRVAVADYVSTEDGTGIVHSAPGFGEDDARVAKEKDIPSVCPVDAEGLFTKEVHDFHKQFVKDADKGLIKKLKNENKLIYQSTIQHSYPHCWRCDSPLIYRSISAWYVRVAEFREKLLNANNQVHWVPETIKHGRFGKWLENARDWNISRNRYWGNPLPVWKCESCEHIFAVGSIKELEEKSGNKIKDIHKHFVDEITVPCEKCKGEMKRIPEVLDCWFESGAMPYAQNHYPFENRKHFEAHFPADFIAEGLDQTRGWFYTLDVLSVLLFDKPAYKNVIVNGLILAEDGKKMSKSLKNYPDPEKLINIHGADAIRLYMISSPAVQAEDLRFAESGVREVVKNILLPLWNSYSFFVTYANIDSWAPPTSEQIVSHPLDKWILSKLQTLIKNVTAHFDSYHLNRGVPEFLNFIDQMTNWYIRRSRRRFWKSENDKDKNEAYYTLYTVLINLVKVIAPVVPYIAESIYRSLTDENQSVHLQKFPIANDKLIDEDLEKSMAVIQRAVYIGRALRLKQGHKVRQPLKSAYFITRDHYEAEVLKRSIDLISEELNVKEVFIEDNEEKVVDLSAGINFKTMGRKLGKKVKLVDEKIKELDSKSLNKLLDGSSITVKINGEDIELNQDSVLIKRTSKPGMQVVNEGSITVVLNTELTEELITEGLSREFVNRVQNQRKALGLEVMDRIVINFSGNKEFKDILKYEDYIKAETLCKTLIYHDAAIDQSTEWDIDNKKCFIHIEKTK